MSCWDDLKHSDLLPGQSADLITDRELRPTRAVFRFRTTIFAVFAIEDEPARFKSKWFRLLDDGTLWDERHLRVRSIRGELLCARAVPFDEQKKAAAHD